MKLSKEQARGLAYDDCWIELGLTVELNEQIDTRRWVSVHRLIVKDRDGKFWATTYKQGLTEYQDIEPFEYGGDEIEFTQVEKVPVTTYEYRDVKS